VDVTRRQVLGFRLARHQLDGSGRGSVDLLDYGVQDTGPDGSAWAIALRGGTADDLFLAWTLRGAPHAYRRDDAAAVALATAPWTEADAASRIYDASKPLVDAGLTVLDALATVAGAMRRIVSKPTVKGEMSAALRDVLPAPYLRDCRVCEAVHAYEMPFRLSALQAGLELEPGTSPPVLRRIPKLKPLAFARSGDEAEPRFDVLRNHLRFYGPTEPKAAAKFLDAPLKAVKARWPDDAVEVTVKGEEAGGWVLAEDEAALADAGDMPKGVALLGPFDPWLQPRDRELLVPDAAARKDLWRTIGRPGGVLVDGEIKGSWRPRTKGTQVGVEVTPWSKVPKRRIEEAAARLAEFRDRDPGPVTWAD
jgi:hypothetical protein